MSQTDIDFYLTITNSQGGAGIVREFGLFNSLRVWIVQQSREFGLFNSLRAWIVQQSESLDCSTVRELGLFNSLESLVCSTIQTLRLFNRSHCSCCECMYVHVLSCGGVCIVSNKSSVGYQCMETTKLCEQEVNV